MKEKKNRIDNIYTKVVPKVPNLTKILDCYTLPAFAWVLPAQKLRQKSEIFF